MLQERFEDVVIARLPFGGLEGGVRSLQLYHFVVVTPRFDDDDAVRSVASIIQVDDVDGEGRVARLMVGE